MTTVVVMPGGFHPFHAGHSALYDSARRAFPDAEVYVAATNDTSSRPFPFALKEKLAKLAGVEPGHFVQVKSPFRAEEITARFDPAKDQLIFVRSEKDADKPPQAGGVKKDGSPAYLQPLLGAKRLEPFAKHAYMAYLPTVEFGPGFTSATEIRNSWPKLDERQKTALVMSLYPATQSNLKLAANVVKMLDTAIGGDLGESTGDRPHDPAPGKEFVSNKHLVKFTPTAVEVYYGGELVLSKPGNFSNPTRQDMYNARRYTNDLFNKKLKQQELAKLASKGVAEGAPIVVAQAPIDVRNPKKAPQPYRNQGDIVPPTTPPSTEKRGVKGRPGQRPMPDQGVAEGNLNEFAPGGQGGNGPFDYGSAIVQIGEDFVDVYNDEGAGADAAAIIKVGKTFLSAGMAAGIKAFYGLDTQVRDHVAEQLMDQGFNVRQDIYQAYTQAQGSNETQTILSLLKEFVKTRQEPEDQETVAKIYKAFQQSLVNGFKALYNAFEFDIDSDFTEFARTRGVDLNDIAEKQGVMESNDEVEENQGWAATFTAEQDGQCAGGDPGGGMMASYQKRENQPVAEKTQQIEDYIEESRKK